MKATRKTLGLSQMQLAERCGISTSFVGEIEICRKFPTPKVLEAIGSALGLKIHQLLYDGDESPLEDRRLDVASFSRDLISLINRDVEILTRKYLSAQQIPIAISEVAENPPQQK